MGQGKPFLFGHLQIFTNRIGISNVYRIRERIGYHLSMWVSRHKSAWRKSLVAFLLLWTLADLTVPGICQSDDDGSQDAQALAQSSASASAARTSSLDQFRVAANSGQQKVPAAQEDCFCCCAHIVPSPHFSFAAMQRSAESLTFYHFNQVTASAPPLYHPPRS
jgi:hypothetical protein